MTTTRIPDPAGLPILLNHCAVATLLHCSSWHVSRLANAGRMPAPLKVGRLVRWRRPDILGWIAAGCPSCRNEKQRVEAACQDNNTDGRPPGTRPRGTTKGGMARLLDLVAMLLGTLVSNAFVGADHPRVSGLVTALVLLLLKYVFARLRGE